MFVKLLILKMLISIQNGLMNLISKFKKDYEVKSVIPILSTSEGMSKRILVRHTYVKLFMIWNLDRESFTRLTKQVNPEINIDKLWKYLGGNSEH